MTHSTEMHAGPSLPDSARKQRWGMRNQHKQSDMADDWATGRISGPGKEWARSPGP